MKAILFIHQGPHPVHGEFASTITDHWYRYGGNQPEIIKNLIKSVLDQKKYDVIFVEGGLGLPHAVLNKLKNPSTRIVLLSADTLLYDLPHLNPLKKGLVKFLLSYVDGFVAISKLNRNIALKCYPEKPVGTVYPYGVKNNFALNCDLKSRNLLFIGNEEGCKRFDLLVEAVKILNDRDHHFQLYLVGSCVQEVPQEYPWLHKEGVQKDLDQYYQSCSLYVHPADFDSCPVVVFEAMSTGMIPLITCNVGEAAILKEQGLGELILEDNQPEVVADKIWEIYQKPDDWKNEISKQCKELTSTYNPENQKKEFKKIFDKLLEELDVGQ
ncbi:MAG: glycosyltransferase [Methanobacteriaceae archaeon]|nr:glycosyltransferase [Methanobacteriaceae archaeon]